MRKRTVMQINSQAEYDDLSGGPEDTPEEHMLIRLGLAVEIWEAKSEEAA